MLTCVSASAASAPSYGAPWRPPIRPGRPLSPRFRQVAIVQYSDKGAAARAFQKLAFARYRRWDAV